MKDCKEYSLDAGATKNITASHAKHVTIKKLTGLHRASRLSPTAGKRREQKIRDVDEPCKEKRKLLLLRSPKRIMELQPPWRERQQRYHRQCHRRRHSKVHHALHFTHHVIVGSEPNIRCHKPTIDRHADNTIVVSATPSIQLCH